MVKGIDVFQEYFTKFNGQYVLIGGSACDLVFHENGQDFRATKDLDVVLIAEALTSDFVRQFWEFIKQGRYEIQQRRDGSPIFYRFQKPGNDRFPYMLELFSRDDRVMRVGMDEKGIIKVPTEDELSSLSAILLNNAYYMLVREGTVVIDGISVLSDAYLLLLKAKAWLNLTECVLQGEHIDGKNIRKHKNDVIRLSMLLLPGQQITLPDEVKADITSFLSAYEADPADLKQLKITGIKNAEIINRLKEYYIL